MECVGLYFCLLSFVYLVGWFDLKGIKNRFFLPNGHYGQEYL